MSIVPKSLSKKTKRIALKARKQVFGDLLGGNKTLFHGEGFEFSELREYEIGDDIRRIDWNTTAKLGKPYVKIFHEERQLQVAAVTVMSGSMHFGTGKLKSEVAMEALALLGFSAGKSGDLFESFLFADRLYEHTKPSKRTVAVYKALESAVEFECIGKQADFEALERLLRKRLKKRSLLFIISDFVGEFSPFYLAKRHDLVCLIVRDRFEEDPQALGTISLIDPETKQSMQGVVDERFVTRYKAKLRQNDDLLFKRLAKSGARFAKLYTHSDVATTLSKTVGR